MEHVDYETTLVVLKGMEKMFLCEAAPGQDGSMLFCFRKPLGVMWQPTKDGRVLITLTPYPFGMQALINDYGAQHLTIRSEEICWVFGQAALAATVHDDYVHRRQEVYGGLLPAKIMPQTIRGRA